jgi:hypothetical protein
MATRSSTEQAWLNDLTGAGITAVQAERILDGMKAVILAAVTSDSVDINGGAIDGTPIGATSASTGAFTTLTVSSTADITGALTAPRLVVNGSTAPTNGAYLPSANTVGIASNGTIAASFAATTVTLSRVTVIQTEASQTYHRYTVSGLGTDLKSWHHGVNTSGHFVMDAVNDAVSLATNAYTITRGSTYNVASHKWSVSASAGTSIGAFAIDASITALATSATQGFPVMPTCAGVPSGVPAGGNGSFIYDTTNNKLSVYNGGWKQSAALS